jgi:hypothetical protein
MIDQPVFRSVSIIRLVFFTPLNKSTFNTLLKNAIMNTGYYERVTIHSIRQEIANNIDSMPSILLSFPSLTNHLPVERSTPAKRRGLLSRGSDKIYTGHY